MNLKTCLAAFATALITPFIVSAQVTWRNVDSDFGPMPPSMHVFRTGDSLDGKSNIAYYVKVPLRDRGIDFDADTALNRGLTPSAYYARNRDPLLVVNCTFFSPKKRNVNMVIDEGKMVSFNVPSVFSKEDSLFHYVSRSAIGIDRRRNADVAWTITDTVKRRAWEMKYGPLVSAGTEPGPDPGNLKNDEGPGQRRPVRRWKMYTAVGGGPSLITDGEVNVTNNQERMFSGKAIKDRHPRTAMGYTADGYLIIMTVEGRNPGVADGATLIQEAEMLRDLGCIEALNLDGGGSSCLLVNGKETIKPSDKTGQRPVPAVFLIKKTD